MTKTMDRKLVALSQTWEVRYLARQFRLSIAKTARIVHRYGRSRKAIKEAMRKAASRERRLRRAA